MRKIYKNELIDFAFSTYASQMYSEKKLKKLAQIIKNEQENIEDYTYSLLKAFKERYPMPKELDWNIGSTIQHFNPNKVIKAFERIKNKESLYSSIGITWVLGEFKIKDQIVVNYLYDVVEKSDNNESWWRAAETLERLNEVEFIPFLKKSLKRRGLKELDYYLNNLNSKFSIIGILLIATQENIQKTIYPRLKKSFLKTKNTSTLINTAWLIGRFKLLSDEVSNKMIDLVEQNENYEVTYYTVNSIINTRSSKFKNLFKRNLKNKDALLRKMAVRGISKIPDSDVLPLLEKLLYKESDSAVISEITKSIYEIRNPYLIEQNKLLHSSDNLENGMINDDSDKWYAEPSIYDLFSIREDPENVCIRILEVIIKKRLSSIHNPVDLACGTGRIIRHFMNKLNYTGKFYAIDRSKEMLDFLSKNIIRNYKYAYKHELKNDTIDKFLLKEKSDLIISSFGFPSSIFDDNTCRKEIKNVYNNLTDEGIFITLGWDESFNDDLNYYWYKYIPDNIESNGFENWRNQRITKIKSPRNCNLSWFKKGINVPLKFKTLNEAAYVMGHLFGRDAAKHLIISNKTIWNMSLGITVTTKDELKNIIT